MKSLAMPALYAFSILIAVGIGMYQTGGSVAGMGALSPCAQSGTLLQPSCLGEGCAGVTYHAYNPGNDIIATKIKGNPLRNNRANNMCFAPVTGEDGTEMNGCTDWQDHVTTTSVCERE